MSLCFRQVGVAAWVLGIELRSSTEQYMLLTTKLSLQPPKNLFVIDIYTMY